jgi:hypothetical protein
MKKVVLSVAAALAVSVAAPALAADMPAKAPKVAPAAAPSPWDIAFGAAITSDYNFRGISQSDLGPAAFAYFEPRFNITPDVQLYAGIAGTSVKLATDPAAEIDLYGGIRPTFGPVAYDFGGIYYWYPRENQFCGSGVPPCLGYPAYTNLNTTRRYRLLGSLCQGIVDRESDDRPRRQRVLLAELAEHRRVRHLCLGHGEVHRSRELPAERHHNVCVR